MTLNQRITAARNHLARAASYIAESLGTDSLHDTERWPGECPGGCIGGYVDGHPCWERWHYSPKAKRAFKHSAKRTVRSQEFDDDPITTDYELRATNPKGHSE